MQHGEWGRLLDYPPTSNSSGGNSSSFLSPSLASYLNPSESSPQTRRDPTSIYRAEISRTLRRFDSNRARNHRPARYPVSSASSALQGSYTVPSRGRGLLDPGTKTALNSQIKSVLEQGWNDRAALGTRGGSKRISPWPQLSTSARCVSYGYGDRARWHPPNSCWYIMIVPALL